MSMINIDDRPETRAIEEAYEDQIKLLFRTLVINLIDGSAMHQNDQQSVARFSAGLKVSQRARDLALNVVGPAIAPQTPSA